LLPKKEKSAAVRPEELDYSLNSTNRARINKTLLLASQIASAFYKTARRPVEINYAAPPKHLRHHPHLFPFKRSKEAPKHDAERSI